MARNFYPVEAALHDGSGDQPPTPDCWGIFDTHGYWFSTGRGPLQFSADQGELANNVAWALNRAFEAGQHHARCNMREALGLEEIG